ncbi:MAG: hypothetical protein ACRYG4_11005 [Janthinobacterium lividum]
MLFSLGGVSAQTAELPEGPGKSVVMENCTACHGAEVIKAKRRSPDEWDQVVNRMLSNGAVLTDDQQNTVLTYLKKYLATSATSRPAAASGVKPGAK